MEQYKKWLEKQIEVTLEDKDLQREHWAYCTAYKKLIEALPIHGVMQAEGSDGVQGAAVGRSVGDNPVRVGFEQRGFVRVREGVACGSANCA